MDIEYPPYTITDKMLNLATSIMEKIGETNYFEKLNRFPECICQVKIDPFYKSILTPLDKKIIV